jgi:hypothetical protein
MEAETRRSHRRLMEQLESQACQTLQARISNSGKCLASTKRQAANSGRSIPGSGLQKCAITFFLTCSYYS